jgi:hypothetical protein
MPIIAELWKGIRAELWCTLSFGSGSPSDHHPDLTILFQDIRPDHCARQMGEGFQKRERILKTQNLGREARRRGRSQFASVGEERWVGILRTYYGGEPLKQMDKHDFSYVLFRAALGAFGVFLITGIGLKDRILIMLGGVCLGLALVASIIYMIHLARGPRYEPRLDKNGDIISIWCLRCMRSNDPKRSHCKDCGRPIK